jgi:muramoyltetrapeptide carboxypeptidase
MSRGRDVFRPPPRLRPGGTIGIAALSGKVDAALLDRGVAYLRARGYAIREAVNLRESYRDFAGDDRRRAEGYLGLLRDPQVDAIIFARGGWGASRALAFVDDEDLVRHPKLQMGGSDLTALLSRLNRCGIIGIHGPMAAVEFARVPPDPETARSWEALARGQRPTSEAIADEDILRPGAGAGPLAGGCLSILVSLEGTPDALETAGRILFLEDVNEETYRVDRMLDQLRRAGRLSSPAGVIIGALDRMTRGGKADERALADVLDDYFGDAPFPVIRNWPSGHGARNRALPLGARVRLDADRRRVEFLEAGVS